MGIHIIPQDVYIFGDGGLAREVKLVIEQTSYSWRFKEFITLKMEDSLMKKTRDETKIKHLKFVVVGIGNPSVRKRIYEKFMKNIGVSFINIFHNSAIIGYDMSFGAGNIFTGGVQATCGIKIGNNNYFGSNVTIGHDVTIGEHCAVNPGANIAGFVTLEGENLIGTGSQILEMVTIGKGAIVGAGAVVTNDVYPGDTVVGVPAKAIGGE